MPYNALDPDKTGVLFFDMLNGGLRNARRGIPAPQGVDRRGVRPCPGCGGHPRHSRLLCAGGPSSGRQGRLHRL